MIALAAKFGVLPSEYEERVTEYEHKELAAWFFVLLPEYERDAYERAKAEAGKK